MTSLAVLLKEGGVKISGSDVADVFQTDEMLKKYKIDVKQGFKKDNIPEKCDLVIVTGAHGGMTNIEAKESQRRGIKTLMHGQALGMFMDKSIGISISGCHGKTTTSALIATVLKNSGHDPSFVIGCPSILPLGPGGHFGDGELFVAEADEYATCPITDNTPRFYWQNPKIAIINNIEFDHPDVYKNLDSIIEAFKNFAQKTPKDGLLIAGIDNLSVQKMIKSLNSFVPKITFGFSPLADYKIEEVRVLNEITTFKIQYKKLSLEEIILKIPGKHNVLNATAAYITANFLGIKSSYIREGLKAFRGTKRRFEKIADINGIALYDDYAHHPSEITATLQAAKEWFRQRRIIVIFQPHTFSRTKILLNEFAKSLSFTNNLSIITDIFPSAREKRDNSINAQVLTNEISKYKNQVKYFPKKEDIIEYLAKNVKRNDVIFTIGAGDIYLWHNDIIKLLNQMNG